jgi:hypothetical protein
MVGVSVCGFALQLLLTMGLQRETASRGSLGTYTQIIFAEVSDRIIFQSKLSVLGLVGTGIILASALYVAVSDFHHASILQCELVTLVQLIKNSGETTGYIRMGSIDERGTRPRLDANNTTHEESQELVSDDSSERSKLLEEPGRSIENV